MPDAPEYRINLDAFYANPYPDLAAMRAQSPIARVPQLGAVLLTRRDDIFAQEKNVAVFSSYQPDGLMSLLMGENMMRKDGDAHMIERRAIFSAVSPKTVKSVWTAQFAQIADRLLAELEPKGACDLVSEFAAIMSAECLKIVTGLTNMEASEIDRTSQGMIDGISNYSGDAAVRLNCLDCTTSIERHVDDVMPVLAKHPDTSMISAQMAAGLSVTQIKANIKLAISGGQNEPRDVIAGAVWALLKHPDQLRQLQNGTLTWGQAFDEYNRWCSPIGMSPRRVAKDATINGVNFQKDDRVFLMFSSANHDEAHFDHPARFEAGRDTSAAIAFGAGPHFCAGVWAARAMIADVALPKLFGRLQNLRLESDHPTKPQGWAFRGLPSLRVHWTPA